MLGALAGVPVAVGDPLMAALPAVSEVFAPPHTACMPPERWMMIPSATNATRAVSRQYSDRSCPRSSDCKAFTNRQNIALTKPDFSVGPEVAV